MKAKKIIALSMALAMSVSVFTACGEEEGAKSESTASSEKETSEQVSAEVSESVEGEEPYEITLMASYSKIGAAGQIWLDDVCEKLNITINWVLPGGSGYEDSLQLMMVDDEKPDAVLIPDSWLKGTTFSEGCEYGIFTDISQLLPEYSDLMAHTAQASWEALDIFNDGRIWGIPRSTMMRADGFCLRKEWLDNLNIDYTEGDYLTADELFDILYQFTYNDPDGNGADDTYGLKAYSKADGTLCTGLNTIFGIGDNEAWAEYDDEVMYLKYSQKQDNYKEYLAFLNKCWEAGIMDPDAFSIDATVSNQRYEAGMYGCRQEFPGNMDVIVDDKSPQSYVFVPGVVAEEGDVYGFPNYSTGIWYYWAITSECERPEKVLELFDYMLSDEQWTNLSACSIEGYMFTIDDEGNYDFSLRDAMTDDEKVVGPLGDMVRRSDGAEFFINKALPKAERDRIAKLIDITLENYVPALDRGYRPEKANDPILIEYNSYMIDKENKIITGEEPIEYWDDVLQGWYDAGGTEYVQQMQDYIASFEN